eukprot:GILI01011999.1.p1 GENE.GILI01011999.1~~GILI01011999.1.p1  ORF type:complete len:639 (-),score=117.57 GILI01011999.1:244-2010(-)
MCAKLSISERDLGTIEEEMAIKDPRLHRKHQRRKKREAAERAVSAAATAGNAIVAVADSSADTQPDIQNIVSGKYEGGGESNLDDDGIFDADGKFRSHVLLDTSRRLEPGLELYCRQKVVSDGITMVRFLVSAVRSARSVARPVADSKVKASHQNYLTSTASTNGASNINNNNSTFGGVGQSNIGATKNGMTTFLSAANVPSQQNHLLSSNPKDYNQSSFCAPENTNTINVPSSPNTNAHTAGKIPSSGPPSPTHNNSNDNDVHTFFASSVKKSDAADENDTNTNVQSVYSPKSPKDSSYTVAVPTQQPNVIRVDSGKKAFEKPSPTKLAPLQRPSTSDHFLSMIEGGNLAATNNATQRQTNVNFHFQETHEENFPPYLEMRAGLHVGPIASGIVGFERPLYDLFGDTVNTAARLESNGQPSTVHILSTTADLLLSTPPPMWLSKNGGDAAGDMSSNDGSVGAKGAKKSKAQSQDGGITLAVPETFKSTPTPSTRTRGNAKLSKFANSVVAAESEGQSSPLSANEANRAPDTAFGVWDALNNPEYICFDPQGELAITLKGIGEVNTLLVKDYRNRKASVVTMSMSTMN